MLLAVDGIGSACEADKRVDKPATTQGAKQMSWVDVARLGKFIPPARVDESVKQLASRPNNLKDRAEPILVDMAATTPDAAGIQKAIARLDGALPSFNDPNLATSGDQPDVGAVKQCALVLYHGLLARAGAAVKAQAKPDNAAIALVGAARGIDGYTANLKHALMDELMAALGSDLYDRATAALDKKK